MQSVAIDEDICTYVQAPFVKAFVRRLVATAVTPNQITFFRLLLGVASAALLATGAPPLLALSAVCLIVSGILDSVDGQLAAAKGCASLSGRIFDGVADGLVFAAVQVGIYWQIRPHLAAAGWDGWAGEVGLVLLVAAVAALQFVGFVFWDYHKNRTRRLTGDRHGVVHRPRVVRESLRQGGARRRQVMLRCYFTYCRFRSFITEDHQAVAVWPVGTPRATFAAGALRPIVRGWSCLGQATNEAAFAVAILGTVFYPLTIWYVLIGLLIVLPPYIVAMRVWTMAVDRRLRAAGVIRTAAN